MNFYKYVEFQNKNIFQADGIRETKVLRYLKCMRIASWMKLSAAWSLMWELKTSQYKVIWNEEPLEFMN